MIAVRRIFVSSGLASYSLEAIVAACVYSSAYLLLAAKRDHRFDRRRTYSRYSATESGGRKKNPRHSRKGTRVGLPGSIKCGLHQPPSVPGEASSHNQARGSQPDSLLQNCPPDHRGARAECDPQTDLPSLLRSNRRHDAVNASHCENQREHSKSPIENSFKAVKSQPLGLPAFGE